jgi:hypothetical protein
MRGASQGRNASIALRPGGSGFGGRLGFLGRLGSQAGRDFNSNLYRIAMLGRFSAEYREGKVVVEHHQPSGVDLSKLSREEREQLEALLRKAMIRTGRR